MDERIKLEPVVKYHLTAQESRRLYIALALRNYYYKCEIDYNEQQLLNRLCNEFKRFNSELIRLHNQDPNNLILSKIRNFIEVQLGDLKKLTTTEFKGES